MRIDREFGPCKMGDEMYDGGSCTSRAVGLSRTGGRTILKLILSLSSIGCFDLRGSQTEDGSKTEDSLEMRSRSRVMG